MDPASPTNEGTQKKDIAYRLEDKNKQPMFYFSE